MRLPWDQAPFEENQFVPGLGGAHGGDWLLGSDVVTILQPLNLFQPVFLHQLPAGINSSKPSAHDALSVWPRWTFAGIIGILVLSLDEDEVNAMMDDADRFRLLGKYRTPRFRIGRTVLCEVRGDMVITGITDAPIPWPIGKHGAGRHSLIVYKGLAKAVRRESNQAVVYWWGIDPQTVTKWRRLLSVRRITEGTSRLVEENIAESGDEMRALGVLKAREPERCRKIAEARRAHPPPPHVLEAMHAARRGSHHTKKTRRRMSETHRQRGTLVPSTIPWTAAEDELVRTLPAEEV